MKNVIIGALMLAGCGTTPSESKKPTAKTADAQGAYITDALSADATDDKFVGEIDDNVKRAIGDDQVSVMSRRLFAEMDKDKSGSVSSPEFIEGAERHHSPSDKAEFERHMSEKFSAVSGDDKVLSQDELKVFLRGQAKAVHHRRHRDDVVGHKESEVETHREGENHRETEHGVVTGGVSAGTTPPSPAVRIEQEHGGRPRIFRGHY